MIDKKGFSFDGEGEKHRRNAYKYLVKLSESCGILPPTLSLSGIANCGKEPVNGGGFADIFRASYHGEDVALKRLREFQVHQTRERVHRVRLLRHVITQTMTSHGHMFRNSARKPFCGRV